MSTYGTMKTRVASEILRDSWASTYVANAIQDAIKDYQGQRFVFNVGRFSIATVAGTDEYTNPSSVKTAAGSALATGEKLIEIDGISCRYNNAAYSLTPMVPASVENVIVTGTRGQPQFYAFANATIRLAPIPDQAYTLYIHGHKTLSTLSADGDTNAWMVEAERLIRARAKVILYRDILRNPGQAKESEAMELAALTSLRREVSTQATNTLEAWGA